jgi:hypothetical protein
MGYSYEPSGGLFTAGVHVAGHGDRSSLLSHHSLLYCEHF